MSQYYNPNRKRNLYDKNSKGICEKRGRFSFEHIISKNRYDDCMSRTARLILSQSFYHIITRGNNRNTVFRIEADYLYFLDLIAKYKKELPFNIYHYCLMPNHVHLLIQTKNAKNFSVFMKKLNLSYFHYYRKHYGWIGHFWQGRFKSQTVGKDEYFIQCGKYIERNPVRAKLVTKSEEYRYSSARYYLKGEVNDLITRDFMYGDLGKTESDRQLKYQEMVIDDIVKNNYKKTVWGSDKQRHNESKKIKYHGKYVK